MDDLPEFLKNKDFELDYITERYIKAEDAYEKLFGDKDDLNKYISTWDYTDEDFLELVIKLENCVKYKKRYKHLYMFLIERVWKNTLGSFIKHRILKIYE